MKRATLLLLVLMVALLSWSRMGYADIPTSERAALIALYHSTNGDKHWNDKTGWKRCPVEADGFAPYGSENTWLGVTVSNDHVTALTLENNNLSGPLPPELADLHYLRSIRMKGNNLTGPIPTQVGNLSSLETLDLRDNRLSNSIPDSLGNLAGLQYLDLSLNCLEGPVPATLGNIPVLLYLYLTGNKLNGEVPASLGNLNWLVALNLDYNSLHTSDEWLRAFLDNHNPDWFFRQTIAPEIVEAYGFSEVTISVTWAPIQYFEPKPGGFRIYYSTTPGGPWIHEGTSLSHFDQNYLISGLNPGTEYFIMIRNEARPHPMNKNTVVSENSNEVSATTKGTPAPKDEPPFGKIDEPLASENPYSGGIAVTGWALDDVEVVRVKIYSLYGDERRYIGDAEFIEGARSDIELLYPGYPYNQRAGWGYMLLSNYLPNGGNGVYTLQAVAEDYLGQETVIGSRTISVDNENAVKPFGAIDYPEMGETVTGKSYLNSGWVLATKGHGIHTDASRIFVCINSVPVGNPEYNAFREDIARLFPGYFNSAGAWGYFFLDTTAYKNGSHQIYWTARDEADNEAVIGSRFFTIQNKKEARNASVAQAVVTKGEMKINPAPVYTRKDFRPAGELEKRSPDENGKIAISLPQLKRLVLELDGVGDDDGSTASNSYSGYTVVGNELRPLPVGSTLDGRKGMFYWLPGPGFLGEYRLAFVKDGGHKGKGKKQVTYVTVKVTPTSDMP